MGENAADIINVLKDGLERIKSMRGNYFDIQDALDECFDIAEETLEAAGNEGLSHTRP